MIRQTEKSISTDKILIARACAKKWGVAPTATDGTQPEFSEANCLAFLNALPDYMFHPFNRYIGNIFNFVDRPPVDGVDLGNGRSEEHTSELQSLMRISYAVSCLNNKTNTEDNTSELQLSIPIH